MRPRDERRPLRPVRPEQPARPVQPVPERVTMPLLALVTQQSLEEDYRHVADQRAAAGTSGARPPRPRLGRGSVAVIAAFGLLVATAAVQTSRNATTDETSRTTLVGRANEGRDRLTELQQRLVDLREETAEASSALDRTTSREASAVAGRSRLQLAGGFVAVAGPGVQVVVDDAPGGEPEGRVRDEDLARLVDGLWTAGAEAIAINGQRMTALTSIRNSSQAINVNSRPLTAPYVVAAIGDPRSLQADLVDTRLGSEFDIIASSLGFVVEMDNVDRLLLPAGPEPRLRHAEPADAPSAELSSTTTGVLP